MPFAPLSDGGVGCWRTTLSDAAADAFGQGIPAFSGALVGLQALSRVLKGRFSVKHSRGTSETAKSLFKGMSRPLPYAQILEVPSRAPLARPFCDVVGGAHLRNAAKDAFRTLGC